MCTNHSSFYTLWSSVSNLVIFVYYYRLVTGSISPKIIENENKLLYMSFFSPVLCQPGKMLFLKRKRSWHIIVAFTQLFLTLQAEPSLETENQFWCDTLKSHHWSFTNSSRSEKSRPRHSQVNLWRTFLSWGKLCLYWFCKL